MAGHQQQTTSTSNAVMQWQAQQAAPGTAALRQTGDVVQATVEFIDTQHLVLAQAVLQQLFAVIVTR